MVGDFGGNEAWLYIAECEFVVGDSVAGAGRRLGLGLFFRWLSGILSFFGGCGLFSSTFFFFSSSPFLRNGGCVGSMFGFGG